MIFQAQLIQFSAYAPHLLHQEQWLSFFNFLKQNKHVPQAQQQFIPPPLAFLDNTQKRRLSPLIKMTLQVAHDACLGKHSLESIKATLSSRFGEMHTTIPLIQELAPHLIQQWTKKPSYSHTHENLLSPTQFAHSVHNAAIGRWSIWAQQTTAHSAIAAQEKSFLYGLLHAFMQIEEQNASTHLMIDVDEALPNIFNTFKTQHQMPMAMALHLAPCTQTHDTTLPVLRLKVIHQSDLEKDLLKTNTTHEHNDSLWPDNFCVLNWLYDHPEQAPLVLKSEHHIFILDCLKESKLDTTSKNINGYQA